MASIVNSDNGVVSGTAGLKSSADSSGVLDLQTNGTTAISISASQVVSFANQPTYTGGTANGVMFLNGSKAVTTGTALTFDGSNLATSLSGATSLQMTSSGSQAFINLRSVAGGGFEPFIGFGDTSASNIGQMIGITGGGLRWTTGGSEQMRLNSTGLGIGTSSPAAKLQVQSGTVTTNVRVVSEVAPSLFYSGFEAMRVGVAAGALMRSFRDGSNGGVGWDWLTTADNGAEISGTYTSRMTLDRSGNLVIGATSASAKFHVAASGNDPILFANSGGSSYNSAIWQNNNSYKMAVGIGGGSVGGNLQDTGYIGTISNIPFTFQTNNTERARITSSGNLLVGTTAPQLDSASKLAVANVSGTVAEFTATSGTSNQAVLRSWNIATSGNNLFQTFHTDSGAAERGTINYNRAGGLTSYNTTSDYRAKDIYGPVIGSGELIDSTPVYMGKMKGATQERPMFIAHETPEYAHTGVKDAVDEDGNPVYQQMDASSLIPVMWAEIQSLRKRLADAGI